MPFDCRVELIVIARTSCRESVEVGTDILRVIGVTVKALAVVLPHEFPIGRNVVVNGRSDLGAIDALGGRNGGECVHR